MRKEEIEILGRQRVIAGKEIIFFLDGWWQVVAGVCRHHQPLSNTALLPAIGHCYCPPSPTHNNYPLPTNII